jgi:two-component system cell cycle sensor histidine kinase/response regulator CckA
MPPIDRIPFHWRLWAGTLLAVVLLLLAVYLQRGTFADLAYAGALLTTLSIVIGMARWAKSSSLVRGLIYGAAVFIIFAQILDISENFPAIKSVPILGSDSSWNGHLNTIGLALGMLMVFTALLRALHESVEGKLAHERYRLLADNAADVISTVDMTLQSTYVSPSVTRLRGFTPEEVMKQRPDEYMTSESCARAIETFQTELERFRKGLRGPEESTNLELEFRCKDGSTVWMETGLRLLLNHEGDPTGIIAVSREITKRRQAEQTLRESEARFRALVENAPVCIHEIDLDGHICSMNPCGLRLVSVEAESEVIGRPYLDYVAESDRARVASKLQGAIAGESVSYEYTSICHEEIRCFTSDVVPVKDDDGRVVRLLAITNDITEQMRAKEARKRLEEQLYQAQKLESVGRLAGGVAHDFNNMLGVVLGRAELALSELNDDCESRAHLVEIRSFCKRAADLTRQLLAFAQRQTAEPDTVHLNQAVGGSLKMLQRSLDDRIQIHWEPTAELWPILVDPSQVDQILLNLVVNARDAITGAGQITIETQNVVLAGDRSLPFPGFTPGEYVRLRVSDTGCGMPPETRDRAFEPFYTTKEDGERTGLGLATVYGIIKQNKGFIGLESEPGHGSTITIHFPRHHGAAPARERKGTPETLARGTETILLVEDEPALLQAAESMLVRLGYTVLTASTPHAAIQVYENKENPIDLLLTDVVMPNMNGRELVETLLARDPALRILYMSGFASGLFGDDGILEENVNFMQKPFTYKQLAAKVREALDQPPAIETQMLPDTAPQPDDTP